MIQIFLKMKVQYIKTEMEYPLNFWLMLLSGVVTRFFGMLVPFIICSNIKTIAGWKQEEIYLIMSFLYLSEGLCSVLFEGIWQLPSMVFNGNFDTILSRPVSPFYQVLCGGMGLHGIGVVLFGFISLNYSLIRLGIFRPASMLMCLFFVLCGTIICMSSYLLTNSLVFWYDAGGRTSIPYMITEIGSYARYPIMIYPKILQFILLFVVPYAFIGMVPVMILTGQHILSLCAALVLISLFSLLGARFVFYRGILHYESMGM
ncbi:ABC transporter permease [Eisenbergiella porci]|uniref:ABC transporter permease n=1 Tax=Eisenbergiella porci TaxID=2652274 RepID=UPI002A8078EB|nr:ABC-2 family transporter protein [Eisenbergiella porci]